MRRLRSVALVFPAAPDAGRFGEIRKEVAPFGPQYLAAVLEQAGYEVAIIEVTDGRTQWDFTGFDAVAFSLPSSGTYGLMHQTRQDSQFRDDTLIMIGGVHCSFYPELSLADFGADVAGLYEGEDTILEILKCAPSRQFSGIPGTLWRPHGEFERGPKLALRRDISDLPLPARHLLPADSIVRTEHLAGRDYRVVPVMFTRGCNRRCHFCAIGRVHIQTRSGASARAELIRLIETYGVDGFATYDDNTLVVPRRSREIFESIGDLGLVSAALARVDQVDPEMLTLMRKVGYLRIRYGAESGSPNMLRRMNKRITVEQTFQALEWTHEAGIEGQIFLLHGYPGENMETTEETIRMLEELYKKGFVTKVSLFRFTALPGSKVYDDPMIRGTHHREPEWKPADWDRFRLHGRDYQHWWGTPAENAELDRAYAGLRAFIEGHWGPQGRCGTAD